MAAKQIRRLLEPYLMGEPQPNGDIDARCPLHDDKKRSARINFDKDVWICFAGCGRGNLAGLLKRMRAKGATPKQAVRRSDGSGRTKRIASVHPKMVEAWCRALRELPDVREMLWSLKGISERTMTKYRIGWDQSSQAFSIPVYLENGSLFNVRMYRPSGPSDQKIRWHHGKNPEDIAPLYPAGVLPDAEGIILCAGEMDTLNALQNGFPAVTGTAGESTWNIRWSEQFKGKQVYIAYDRDATGDRGARMVAEHLEQFASSIHIVKIPINERGADVTDFFGRYNREDFKALLKRSKLFQKRNKDPMSMEPFKVSVMDSFDSQNVGRAQKMELLISGRSKEPYTVPKVVNSTCTMDAGPKCSVCPMLSRGGEHTFQLSASSPHLLNIIGSPLPVQRDTLREAIGAVRCDRLKHDIQSYQTVEQLYVRPSWDEVSGDFTPRRINSVGKHDTMPSQVVEVIGTTWPDPKQQHNEFLAWDVAEAENAIDEFKVTPDIVRDLKQFRPVSGESPLAKLGDIAVDMEQHVTRIYGRLDLHMAVDLVFNSIVSFPFQGSVERRGWLDVLVVGDTRTGKSEVAQRVLEHYGAGQFVNCEAATFAGIIGGLQQMADRQWAVTWGVVPMSDRRLVVLDEASGLSYEQIANMSDVRSRGIIRLQKIQSEQAWARTRLVWLSNPRDESMERYTYGIQAIPPLIGNREDIARFDFAMALTSRDVTMKSIYQSPSRKDPRYSSEDCHKRIMWAWSRRAEDVSWDEGIEAEVLRGAEWLGEQYISEPPLLQAANAHVKLARISVAVAASVFSTDSSGRHIIVKREHVHDAARFIHHLYSKETFGYHRMSARYNETRKRAHKFIPEAHRFLLENRMLIEFLQRTEGSFRREMVEQMMNVSREEANGIVNQLFAWGLVSPNGYAVKVQPELHQLLRQIEKERV